MQLGKAFATGIIFSSIFMMSQNNPSARAESSSEIQAMFVDHAIAVDAAHPAAEWKSASPIAFASDWQGKNPDSSRETQVRVLWSETTLYLRFECRYRELFVFTDSDANGRRDHLWDRDVAETFLQPDPSREHYYREFEVSPNGMWIDLDIFPGGLANLKSEMQRSVFLDEKSNEGPDPALRFKGDLAGQFFSRGRTDRTASVSGLAADQDTATKFSRTQSVWKNAICQSKSPLVSA
jgi:hypothetical protein